MLTATVLLIILGVLLYFLDYVKNIRFYQQAAKIPGPKALPLLGNALHFAGKDSSDAYDTLWNIFERYSSPCRVWLGNQLWIGVYEPDQMKTLLTSPKSMEKAIVYKFAQPWLGNSLILAPGNSRWGNLPTVDNAIYIG